MTTHLTFTIWVCILNAYVTSAETDCGHGGEKEIKIEFCKFLTDKKATSLILLPLFCFHPHLSALNAE